MANQHSFREGRTMVVGAIPGGAGGGLSGCVWPVWVGCRTPSRKPKKPFSTFEITDHTGLRTTHALSLVAVQDERFEGARGDEHAEAVPDVLDEPVQNAPDAGQWRGAAEEDGERQEYASTDEEEVQ